jgi:hypothetical protein
MGRDGLLSKIADLLIDPQVSLLEEKE